jgi:exodeoxyribonuclease VII large subunit
MAAGPPRPPGFVRVTAAADGRTLTHAADARAAGRLLLRFGDGECRQAADGTHQLRRTRQG